MRSTRSSQRNAVFFRFSVKREWCSLASHGRAKTETDVQIVPRALARYMNRKLSPIGHIRRSGRITLMMYPDDQRGIHDYGGEEGAI